jgi:hypothetical protein
LSDEIAISFINTYKILKLKVSYYGNQQIIKAFSAFDADYELRLHTATKRGSQICCFARGI